MGHDHDGIDPLLLEEYRYELLRSLHRVHELEAGIVLGRLPGRDGARGEAQDPHLDAVQLFHEIGLEERLSLLGHNVGREPRERCVVPCALNSLETKVELVVANRHRVETDPVHG